MDLSNTPPVQPVFLPRGNPTYVMGVDLGKERDFTAITVVERQAGVLDFNTEFERHTNTGRKAQKPSVRLVLRHVERLPLGMSHTDQGAHIAAVRSRPPLDVPPCKIILDIGNCGDAVAEMICKDHGIRAIKYRIHGGSAEKAKGPYQYNIPKSEIVSSLSAALDSGRLLFAHNLREGGVLRNELQDFERKISESGRATWSARGTAHDDIVISLGMCTFYFRRKSPVAMFGAYGSDGTADQTARYWQACLTGE